MEHKELIVALQKDYLQNKSNVENGLSELEELIDSGENRQRMKEVIQQTQRDFKALMKVSQKPIE